MSEERRARTQPTPGTQYLTTQLSPLPNPPAHAPSDPDGEPHSHPHQHGGLVHKHPHYPDLHHRHEHA
jgi:hypothetical protein